MIETVDRHYDVPEEVEAWIRDQEWTDGLAVTLPTVDRVDRFLAASGLDPEEVVGPVAPMLGVATVGNVAVNAVMAGCLPHHLPLVIAAIRALMEPRVNLGQCVVTTNPVGPLLIVNGPRRAEWGLSSGRRLLGPGPHWNGAVGRAVRLVIQNVGGALGDVDMATHGSPMKFSFLLAENEEESPWEPYHVSQGFERDDSVVSAVGVESFVEVCPVIWGRAEVVLHHFATAMQTHGTNQYNTRGSPVIVLNPSQADVLHRAGIRRRDVQERLFEDSKVPLERFPYGNFAEGHWREENGKVLVCERPEDVVVVVAGGSEGNHGLCLIPFGNSWIGHVAAR